jgi:hypothetical protein
MPPKLVYLQQEVTCNGLNAKMMMGQRVGIKTTDDAGQMNERYQQCALEIKLEKRILGPLQIHQESMQRLTSQSAGFESSRTGKTKKTTKKNFAPRKGVVDPILAIRSIFTPRRTGNNNADLSGVVLPGRRGSIFVPVESDGCVSGSSVSTSRNKKQKELEGLSDLDFDSIASTPPSTASMSQQTRERSVHGEGGGRRSRRGGRRSRRRSSHRSRDGKSTNSVANVKSVRSGSDSINGLIKTNISTEEKGEKSDMNHSSVQQGIPDRPRGRLGKRRSSLFSVDERRASVDNNDADGVGGLTRAGGGSSCDNSIEVLSRTSSLEGKDGTSLICKFPSRNTSPGYSGDDDTLICDWERRQSNVSSASSISNPEELPQQHDKEKEVSGSLICGWNESQVSILSESSASLDERVLQHAVKSCTLFDSS